MKRFRDPSPLQDSDDEDVVVEYTQTQPTKRRGSILAAKTRHEPALLAQPGVRGVGITQNSIGDDVVVIYVAGESVIDHVPKSLDGFAVKTVIVGEIDAQ